jgi:hypothetical protein
MKPVFKIVLVIGIACMLAALTLYLLNRSTDAEPFLIASLLSIAIGIRGASALKGFAYPVMIFGVVSTAMIFPHYFL